MVQMAYDPTNVALYHPEAGDTVFKRGPWPGEVALAAQMSRLAYLRVDTEPDQLSRLESALQLADFAAPELFVDGNTDSYGFGTINPQGLVILAFRGTQADHFDDFITNIQFRLAQWPDVSPHGRVHQGFNKSAQAMLEKALPWLKQIEGKRSRLLICGHSLGGAIATLLALPTEADALITLGCPRVGDDDFARYVQSAAHLQITRVVNCCDVVPTVPFEFMGYVHVGNATHLDRHGQILVSPQYAQLKADRSAAVEEYNALYLANPLNNVPFRRLADHAPGNYIRAFWP